MALVCKKTIFKIWSLHVYLLINSLIKKIDDFKTNMYAQTSFPSRASGDFGLQVDLLYISHTIPGVG